MDEAGTTETQSAQQARIGSCAIHPDREAMLSCVRCGNYACAECVGEGDEADGQCPACREREGSDTRLAWEEIETPWPRGYLATAWKALRTPSSTFDRPFRGDIGTAQRFAWLSSLVGYVPLLGVGSIAMLLGAAVTSDAARGGSALGTLICGLPCALILYPTISFIYFTGIGVVLQALTGGQARYHQSASAAYYASAWELVSAVAAVLLIVPLIGPVLWLGVTLGGVAWRTVALRAFAMRAHRLSPGAATAAAFFAAACWQILGFVVMAVLVGSVLLRRFG